ncbi:MAG TPA: type IV pilin protein [Egibacteraceae bacterium]|nr:type IV pilin protein [Egibacteraceae bacterium]
MTIQNLREREDGFTLIELLVVIIIIGILAAIAIPTFLNQREKGWDSAAKSDLKSAAIAQESYFTENNGYAGTTALLNDEGFNGSNDVDLTFIGTATGDSDYCMSAAHESSSTTWYLDSEDGVITTAACS